MNLRCLEDMSFKEISKIEQTSEVYTRILFHRTVEKFRVALKKQGFRKASLILALTMFGRLTAVTTATIITTAATIGTSPSNTTSIHYVIQGVTPVIEQTTNTTQAKRRASSSSPSSSPSSSSFTANRAHIKYQTKGTYENKLFMPNGLDGPVMRFMQRWNIEQTGKKCSWLQDGSGNYYYHSGQRTMYITNNPLRMLILPTDSPDFVKFVFSQVGCDSRFSYEKKFLTGLVKYSVDNRVPYYPDYKCKYSYNSLEHSDLSADWPQPEIIQDMRDQMHKRGWTFFKISGYINDTEITGAGRIPFVYDMYQDHLPWISLRIGDETFVDYPGNIAMAETKQKTLLYENETFFDNFCRPWEGLPCIDSVRRDAAKYRMQFTTEDQVCQAKVTVFYNDRRGRIAMVYVIDKAVDVIRSIQYVKDKKVFGELQFDYMQDISTVDADKMLEPQTEITSKNRTVSALLIKRP